MNFFIIRLAKIFDRINLSSAENPLGYVKEFTRMLKRRAVTALTEQHHIRLGDQGADADAVFHCRYWFVVAPVDQRDLALEAAKFVRIEHAGIDVLLLVARKH